VELFQSWQLLDHPRMEFFKLLGIAIFALALGVLPYLDNWSHSRF
jgi:membrane-associated HD superfamily phosphohydrolase